MPFQIGNRLYEKRRSYEGKNNPFYGKKHKNETRKKIGVKKGNIPWNKGKQNIYSNITLKKMKKAKKEYVHWNKGLTREIDNRIEKYIRYGEKSNFWHDGSSFEPYGLEFNNSLKKQIFQRDSGICQECHKLVCDGHAIHHIDYKITNCSSNNLLSLCRRCHATTSNYDRNEWMNYFTERIIDYEQKI